MATYKDFNGVLKEPIEVDANPQNRWTPQRVRFINKGNEFYGKFIGSVVINDGISANNCELSNSHLRNCTLYKENGEIINLDNLINYGVMYRGVLSTDIVENITSFRDLFIQNRINPPVNYGNMYMTKGPFRYLDGVKIGNNDILIANKNISSVQTISKECFDIINSQDSDVVHFEDLEDALSGYVTLSTEQKIYGNKQFTNISVDKATIKVLNIEQGIELSSVSLENLSSVNGFIESLSVGSFAISDDSIEKSKIIGLDSDISYLSNSIFGRNQLSDKVQFLLSVGHDSMEYKDEIKTGLGECNLSTFLHVNGLDDESFIKRGFMYRIAVDSQLIVEDQTRKTLHLNDYVIFNKDTLVKEATIGDVDVINDASLDQKEIYSIVSSLSDYVYGLSSDTALTSDDNGLSIITNINQASGLVSVSSRRLVSSDVYGLSDWVKARIEDLDVDVISAESGWLIDSVWQENGKLSATKRQIVSSDVGNLSDYVNNEINLSIQNLTSEIVSANCLIKSISQKNGTLSAEYTKVTNDYIEDNSICQEKISGLVEDLFNISSDLSTVIRRNRGDVSLMGDFRTDTHGGDKITSLEHLLKHNINENVGYEVKKGFMYNINFENYAELNISDSLGNEVVYQKNDFIIFKDNIVISSTNISDIYRIKDYDSEISDLVVYVDTRIKNLSVEDISADKGHIIYSIFENDGIVSARTRELLSSDVNHLEEYVQNEVSLSIDSLQSELLSDNHLIKSITQTKGILTAEYAKVGNDFIEDGSISQNKITNLTTDLSNISSDLSSVIHKVNTISNDTEIPTGYIISSLKQNEGKIEFGSSQILSNYVVGLSDWVKARIEDLDVDEISSIGNQVIEKIWEIDGKISATARTLVSSDVSGLKEYVDGKFNELCSESFGAAFILSNENSVLCSNTYNGIQKFDNISSKSITVPYVNLIDEDGRNLSSELNAISTEIDLIENDVSAISSHYERTFEKDVDVAVTGKTMQFDMLKMMDEANNGKQYTMHLSGGTIVLIPSK